MANHLRKQIRDGVVTAVTGLSTTGARVFNSRPYALQASELPGLVVSTPSRSGRAVALPMPRLMEYVQEIRIDVYVETNSTPEDTVDQICKEVEIALAMPCASLAGLIKTITNVSDATNVNGDAEKKTGQATMTFAAVYMAFENAPDVAQ